MPVSILTQITSGDRMPHCSTFELSSQLWSSVHNLKLLCVVLWGGVHNVSRSQRPMLAVFLTPSPSHCVRQGLSPSLKLSSSERLAGQWAEDLNLCPHVCATGAVCDLPFQPFQYCSKGFAFTRLSGCPQSLFGDFFITQ